MLISLLKQEFFGNKKFSLIFTINLIVGLLGFLTLDSFKRQYAEELSSKSQENLSADFKVTSRNPFTNAQQKAISDNLPSKAKTQTIKTLYSMASTANASALVELKGIENSYPFYGNLTLSNNEKVFGESKKEILLSSSVWVSPQVLDQLDTSIGEKIKIGQLEFVIHEVISDDTAIGWIGTSLAPTIYIDQKKLVKAGLIKTGSTISHHILFKLPQDKIADFETGVRNSIHDPSIRLTNHLSAGRDGGRLVKYLTDYLGLVALVALFLANLGVIYLFREYLVSKHYTLAILKSIGLSPLKSVYLYWSYFTILSFLAAILANLITMSLLPIFNTLIAEFTSQSMSLSLDIESFFVSILIANLSTSLISIPYLYHVYKSSPQSLFQESFSQKFISKKSSALLFIPALIYLYTLSIWQAKSLIIGSIFFLSLILSLVFSSLFFVSLLKLMKNYTFSNFRLSMTWSFISSKKVATITTIGTISIGLFLINLIPQIENILLHEISSNQEKSQPSLFLFDIQEEQKEHFVKLLSEENINIFNLSPMIRGRLLKVNNEQLVIESSSEIETREAENSRRMKNRGANLSYRSKLLESEEIIQGKFYPSVYHKDQAYPELSIEVRYAKRLGIKLGDILTFDIQGLDIDAKITSLKSIKWNSFDPNFFIQIQPGVIDDAPKTYLASLSSMPAEKRRLIQKRVVRELGNISIIDVSKLIDKIRKSILQMSLILKTMSLLTIFAGLFVIFTLFRHQAKSRQADFNLLKILGSSFQEIRIISFLETLFVTFTGILIGNLFCLLTTWIIGKELFNGLWDPQLTYYLLINGTFLILTIITNFLATNKTINRPPLLKMNQ